MITQNKNIPEPLMQNAEISGVKLSGLSLKLTSGHGLYIQSDKGDQYIDLRLCADKPFWGHTHPLLLQLKNSVENLGGLYSDFTALTIEEIKNNEFQNEKIILTINEKNILDLKDSLDDLILQLLNKNEVIVKEEDLILFCDNQKSYFHKIDCAKIISFSFLEKKLLLPSQDDPLFSAMQHYLDFLVFGEDGKMIQDRELINKWLISSQLDSILKLQGNYLVGINEKNLHETDFLKHGILINSQNLGEGRFYLAVPLSCTKDELSDTLSRIHQVIRE